MLIRVRYAPPLRRWHRRLGERLVAAGQEVWFEPAGPSIGRRSLAIERALYGIVADWDAPAPAPTPVPSPEGRIPDATLVLAGPSPKVGIVLTFDANGRSGEAGLLAAARSGRAPDLVVRGGLPGAERLLAVGSPAIEDPDVSARAMETLLPRLVTLLVQAVARLDRGEGDPLPERDASVRSELAVLPFLARGLGRKLARRFGSARGRPEHWRLAFCRDGSEFVSPPDDADCFRADPFLFEEAGRLWLFFEEFRYATGKGVIGCAMVPDPSAEWAWRPALEEPFHLSYPLVLRHGGAIYMMPESSAAGRVRLYRADPFPQRWVPDAVLIEGRRLADATPVFHEGRWWLFATSSDDGGSSWDRLDLFHAPDLLGPWTPHAANPVSIDAGAARPAGPMWHEDGVLMRPAQDCRAGYGAALVICRVDRLDEGGFRQAVVQRIDPPGDGAFGIHTLSRQGGWEAVDVKVAHPPRAKRAATAINGSRPPP